MYGSLTRLNNYRTTLIYSYALDAQIKGKGAPTGS